MAKYIMTVEQYIALHDDDFKEKFLLYVEEMKECLKGLGCAWYLSDGTIDVYIGRV
jgi:hypothetical protein